MWFLPKDYVWVNTRIDKAHEKYDKNLSIETEFDIKDKTVIFTARVKIKDTEQVFTWHSFWETGKEKSFEKLETVAVWRALAFAWFETRDWIASREEMEVFDEKKNEVWAKTAKQEQMPEKWFNESDFEDWTKSWFDTSINAWTTWMLDNWFTNASNKMKEKVKNYFNP